MADEDGITPFMAAGPHWASQRAGAIQDMATRLIAAGADVNVRNAAGETPLMLATGRPNIEAVKALLQTGADVKAKAKNGDTALDIASRGYVWPDRTVHSPEIVDLLSSYAGKR